MLSTTQQENYDYNNWLPFYKKDFNHLKFNNLKTFKDFSNKCSNDTKCLKTLNYGKRFIDLADNIIKLDEGSDSWQIFFLVVCIESIYRIQNNKQNDRKISGKSVEGFCKNNFLLKDKTILENCFIMKNNNKKLTFDEIIFYFYKIRCDIAHKGLYDGFHWNQSNVWLSFFIEYEKNNQIQKDIVKIKNMTYREIRHMFIRAIIKSVF